MNVSSKLGSLMLPWRNQNLNARQSPVDVPKVLDITGMRGEISCAFLTWRNLNLSLGGSFKKQLHGYIHLILLNISDLVSSSVLMRDLCGRGFCVATHLTVDKAYGPIRYESSLFFFFFFKDGSEIQSSGEHPRM